MQNWFNGFVTTTAFKYIVAIVATQIANWLGFDPISGKADIEGILMQLIAVAMGIWGMWESTRNKVVQNGKKVNTDTLPAAEQAKVKAVVAKDKGVTVESLSSTN